MSQHFIVQVTGSDGNDWLVLVFAREEEQAAHMGMLELQARLRDIDFPAAGTIVKVIPGADLLTSPYEVPAATWAAWTGLQDLLGRNIRYGELGLSGEGAPTDGTSGTGAGVASIGCLYQDVTNGKLYINTNTEDSPLWTVVGAQTA